MARIVGAPSRPQAVFVGFHEDDAAVLAMSSLVAGHAVVEPEKFRMWLHSVHPHEWDVVIAREPFQSGLIPDHMFVFAMGNGSTGYLKASTHRGGATSAMVYRSTGRQPSKRLRIETGIQPAAFQRLVNQDLVPWLEEQPQVPYLVSTSTRSISTPAFMGQLTGTAFASDADFNLIAGHFQR